MLWKSTELTLKGIWDVGRFRSAFRRMGTRLSLLQPGENVPELAPFKLIYGPREKGESRVPLRGVGKPATDRIRIRPPPSAPDSIRTL